MMLKQSKMGEFQSQFGLNLVDKLLSVRSNLDLARILSPLHSVKLDLVIHDHIRSHNLPRFDGKRLSRTIPRAITECSERGMDLKLAIFIEKVFQTEIDDIAFVVQPPSIGPALFV